MQRWGFSRMVLLFESIFIGFFSEIGDKTQWIALSLSLRSGRPGKVLAAVFTGSLLNHLIAAGFGEWLSAHVPTHAVSIAMAVLFFLFGVWAIRTPRVTESATREGPSGFAGVTMLFFLAETADKTQLATLALAAKSGSLWLPALGTTLGTVLSDLLGITLGVAVLRKIPEQLLRYACAGLFFALGAISLTPLT